MQFSKSIAKYMVAIGLVFVVGTSFASDDGMTVKAKTEITVESFDAKTQSYTFAINSEPAVGPNIAAKEDLLVALGLDAQQMKLMKKDVSRLLGRIYVLAKPVKLMDVEEQEAKQKPSRSKTSK